MTTSLLVAIIAVLALLGLSVFIGTEMETEGQLRSRQAAANERRQLHDERDRLDEARRRLETERHKLARDRKLYGQRCPNCPFRDPPPG